MIFLAKPYQSYDRHVELCVRKWEEWVDVHGWVFEHFSGETGISAEELKRRTLLAVVLHDLGKMIAPFQESMQSLARNAKPRYDGNHYRHEVASFPYALQAAMRLAPDKSPTALVEAFAILGHHRSMDKNWRKFRRESGRRPTFISEGITRALGQACTWMRQFGWGFPDAEEFRDPSSPPLDQAEAILGGWSKHARRIHVSERSQFLVKNSTSYGSL